MHTFPLRSFLDYHFGLTGPGSSIRERRPDRPGDDQAPATSSTSGMSIAAPVSMDSRQAMPMAALS